MALTTRKKRDLNRQQFHRDASLCIVAVEGAKTESIYLSLFQDVDSPLFNRKVRVIPLTDQQEHRTSPVVLVERLDAYREENGTAHNDQFWVVSDVDHWVAHGHLQRAFSEGVRKGYQFGTSNPCFEIWLYLHTNANIAGIAGLSMAQQKTFLTKALKASLGGYSKSKFDANKLAGLVDVAVANAKQLDAPPCSAWPNTLGTTVYRLIDWIRTH